MPDSNELIAALERLLSGTASETDRSALQIALNSGVLVTGERAVALGGNASDAIITSGDGNIIFSFKGNDAGAVQSALGSIAAPRLHQVPPPPADFTGRRDELQELLTAIEHGGVTISGLQGLGGIGKTALALKLVEQLKPRYPDAQFYIDLKGASNEPLTVTEALAHVIRAYNPLAKLPESQADLHGLYLSVLEGRRAILLMDNAASSEQVGPLIPPTGSVLLVTSRWHFTLPGLTAKNLDTLTPEDARALLLAIAPRIGTWADEIATLCGHLPLALRLAAGSLAKYVNLKPTDYARRLQDTQQRLKLIDASLSLSYELLSEELRERWWMLAVFVHSFADDAAVAVWDVTLDQGQDTLGQLIAASMVEWDEKTDRYRLHDLAWLFANSKLSATECANGLKRHATHYKDVLSVADDLYLQGGEALAHGLALFDREWANIQAGQAWVAAHDESDEEVARLGIAYPDLGADLLYFRQYSRERIRWLEIALVSATRLKDRANEGVALGNLGTAYENLGETQRAIVFYKQALLIARELGDRRSEGIGLGNLGIAYKNLGDTQRAIQFYEQQLAIVRQVGDHKGEGNALGNLGNAYALLNEHQRAIQFYEQALLIARELGDRRGEALGLGNLGIASQNLGYTQRAIEFHKQALLIDRDLGGRRSEGADLGNLGLAYADLGETHCAIEFYEQQLTIVREIGDRRGEGNALWNMSLALDRLGQRARAIQRARQSLIIREQIEDPSVAKVRAQLVAWRETSGQE